MKKDKMLKDSSASLGKGYAIGVSVLSTSLLFAVFPMIGLWIDKQCGTGLLFAALGLTAGMYTGIKQLINMGRKSDDK